MTASLARLALYGIVGGGILLSGGRPLLAADLPTTQPTVASAATKPAEQNKPVSLQFPTFGSAFQLPGGWTEIPREKSGRIGQWIGPDSKPEAIKSLIMIESGRAAGLEAEVFARGLARNFGGIVLDGETTLAGERALRVRADNHDDTLAPTEAVVCVRGGNVYLIMGGTVQGRSVQKEVDAVAASWKWVQIEKPAGHLAFRAEPFAAFDGSVRLNVPAMMHENPSDDPETQLDLALYNLARNNPDFRATFTLTTMEPGETLPALRDRLMKGLAGRYQFVKDAPTWHDCPADTPRLLSNVVEAARPQPAETDTLHHQWAVVSLGEQSRHAVLVHFSHEAESDEERQKYEGSASQIVKSVSLLKKSDRSGD